MIAAAVSGAIIIVALITAVVLLVRWLRSKSKKEARGN